MARKAGTAVAPISLDRVSAAAMLGVSTDILKEAQHKGELRAKNTKFHPKTGRAIGKTLYSVTELQRWFDSLGDA